MKIYRFLSVVTLLLLLVSAGSSEEIKRTATVASFHGEVMVKNPGPGTWTAVKVGDVLGEGSFIKTGTAAEAILNVDDGKTAVVDLGEKSLASFATLVKDSSSGMKKTLLDLAIGQVLIRAEKLDTPDSKFEVKTPTSVVGVRGTKFSVKVEALK